MKEESNKKILKILLKDFSFKHTISSLSKEIRINRVGVWKALKKLEKEKLIKLEQIGKEKTSVILAELNFNNPVTYKSLSLLLTEEASNQERWIYNFSELENHLDFLVLYGSILYSKEANDIDILAIVTDKNSFKPINEAILRIQKSQAKKIHLMDLTKEELKEELKKQNKAYFDALKKGIVIFGQDNYIKFIRALKA